MSKIQYYTDDFLTSMRYQTDPLADRAINTLYNSLRSIHFRKLFEVLLQNDDDIPAGLPSEVGEFLDQSRRLPSWAQQNRMERGSKFFSKYAPILMAMLGMLSLPYCYAAANGARVLFFSERLRNDPGKRLTETGQYIFDVTGKSAFSTKGRAMCSSQKVRLMHAVIRHHIQKSNEWNEEGWGKPINQEDMAGTNLAISLIAIRGLRKMGIQVSYEEAMDYIHLWNVAGYLMGIDERLLPDTGKEAFLLDKMIVSRQFAPSEAGKTLTASLLKYTAKQADSVLATLAPAYMRFLLGDKVSDLLDVPQSAPGSNITLRGMRALNMVRNIGGYSKKNHYQAYAQLRKQGKGQNQFKWPAL